MSKSLHKLLFFVAGTLLLTGAAAKIFDIQIAPYIFSVGAFIVIVLQLLALNNHKTEDFHVRRLYLIAFIASLLLALSAYLMFTFSNLWVVGILIYALISLYISFRS